MATLGTDVDAWGAMGKERDQCWGAAPLPHSPAAIAMTGRQQWGHINGVHGTPQRLLPEPRGQAGALGHGAGPTSPTRLLCRMDPPKPAPTGTPSIFPTPTGGLLDKDLRKGTPNPVPTGGRCPTGGALTSPPRHTLTPGNSAFSGDTPCSSGSTEGSPRSHPNPTGNPRGSPPRPAHPVGSDP